MRIFRLLLCSAVFGVSSIPSIAMLDDAPEQPVDAGCLVPIDHDCGHNGMTGECGEPCLQVGNSCGYSVLYNQNTYQWARPLLPGENLDTYDGLYYTDKVNCGDTMICACKVDPQLNLSCEPTLILHSAYMQTQMRVDINSLCAPGGGGGSTGGGGGVGGE
jgi:hypothetical protein